MLCFHSLDSKWKEFYFPKNCCRCEAIPCGRQSTKYKIWVFFFLVIFGATLSRLFARQIFTSFLSRKDLTKLKKQKNGFSFFVLFPTRYDKARQSQQKLQFCTLFCTPTRNALSTLSGPSECDSTGAKVPILPGTDSTGSYRVLLLYTTVRLSCRQGHLQRPLRS